MAINRYAADPTNSDRIEPQHDELAIRTQNSVYLSVAQRAGPDLNSRVWGNSTASTLSVSNRQALRGDHPRTYLRVITSLPRRAANWVRGWPQERPPVGPHIAYLQYLVTKHPIQHFCTCEPIAPAVSRILPMQIDSSQSRSAMFELTLRPVQTALTGMIPDSGNTANSAIKCRITA